MSNPFGNDIFDPIDDPLFGQLEPFREAFAPFKDNLLMNPMPYSPLEGCQTYLDEFMRSQDNPFRKDPVEIADILECQIENTVIRPASAVRNALDFPFAVGWQEPVLRHVRTPDPPVPEETWSGFSQPPIPGFGRIRASRAGIRNVSSVCESKGQCCESCECNNSCEHFDPDFQGYQREHGQSSFEEEFSE